MRVFLLLLLLLLQCSRFANSLPALDVQVAQGRGSLLESPAVDRVLVLLEDAWSNREAGEGALPATKGSQRRKAAEGRVVDHTQSQAAPSNAPEEAAHLHPSPLSVTQPSMPPKKGAKNASRKKPVKKVEDAAAADVSSVKTVATKKKAASPLSVGHADRPHESVHGFAQWASQNYASLGRLITQIQTDLQLLGEQALAKVTSNGGSSSLGLIIGISVGSICVCVCVGCLIVRRLRRTPNVKQGWRHASMQRVSSRKFPGSTGVALQGGGKPLHVKRPSHYVHAHSSSTLDSTAWPPSLAHKPSLDTTAKEIRVESDPVPTEPPHLH